MRNIKVGMLVTCLGEGRRVFEVLEIQNDPSGRVFFGSPESTAFIESPGTYSRWEPISKLRSIWDDNPDTDGNETLYTASCCRDPHVRGGKCENCDTWVNDPV